MELVHNLERLPKRNEFHARVKEISDFTDTFDDITPEGVTGSIEVDVNGIKTKMMTGILLCFARILFHYLVGFVESEYVEKKTAQK